MFLLIFTVSFLGTLVSSMSGGGSAIITIPTWIFLGFPLPVALTASQINGALWTPVAALNYLRGKDLDRKLLAGLIAFGLCGAYLGGCTVMAADTRLMEKVVGVVILGLVALALMHKKFGVESKPPLLSRASTAILAFPLGFYEAFFGSGNGIFTSAVLTKSRGYDLLTALGYYYIVSCTWCIFAAQLYVRRGHGNISLIVPSALGGVAGAYIGSRVGRAKGARFVKLLFAAVGAVLGTKLALGL